MLIKIKLFGILNEICKTNELCVNEVSNSENLLNYLYTHFPAIKKINFKIAVNQKIIKNKVKFNEKDDIALLPPFAGG